MYFDTQRKSWLGMAECVGVFFVCLFKCRKMFIFHYIGSQNFVEMLCLCSCFVAMLCKSTCCWMLVGEYCCIPIVADTIELL